VSPVNFSNGAPNYPDTRSRARAGVDAGVQSFDAAAQAVASDGTRGQVSATHLVDALAARNQVAYSARLLRTADQMIGTLLDLRA